MQQQERSLVRVQSQFDEEQLALIRQTVAKGTTPDQFKLFVEVCKYHRLNPFARQIYAVVRNSKQSDGSYEKQMTIQTSIDGYRLLAERSGKYAGQVGPEWCGTDGKWVDVWLKDEPPTAARIGVLRKDFAQPTWGIAKYKSYAQNTPLWTKMPDVLLAKCAESLALRKAFPAEMSGIYTAEEMAQADHEERMQPSPLPAQNAEVTGISEVVEGEVVATMQPRQVPPTPMQSAGQNTGQSAPLLKMIAKSKQRVEALGEEWEAVKWEALQSKIEDCNLEVQQVATINGHITQIENENRKIS
jgi:phage recombination protein Bet